VADEKALVRFAPNLEIEGHFATDQTSASAELTARCLVALF